MNTIKLFKNNKQVRKMQTAAGGPLRLTPAELKYLEWSKMTPELKREYRTNRAKSHLLSGPNITNFWEAFQTYIGNRDPENPHLQAGDVPNPGMRNPKLIVQGALKVKTIAERAAKISDKVFDRQYLRALSSGNSKRVLAVRDLHFKGKTGNNLILTTYRSLLSNKRSESQGLNPYNDVRHTVKHEGYFSTSSKDVANTYKYEEDSPLFSIYTHMKNPYVVDANGRSWLAVEIFSPPGSTAKYGRTTDLIVKRVLSEGNNDGVVIKNIMDVGAKRANLNGASEIADDYITFPGRAKLKDAITYDNNGNIIPISLRDNFLINDIRYKQGGKMNILEFLKNGSGIHIKEKNKGKFTSYCGGKVTDECIRKAKASGNPTLVKRATFAANARKWKHKDGGKAFVNGVSILDSNPDAYKYVKKKMKKAAGGTKLNNETILTIGKTALNGLLGFIQTSALNNNLLKLADALKAQNKVQPEDFLSMMDLEVNLEIQNEMEQAAAIKAMTGLTINVNPDMARNKVWKRVTENYSKLKKAIDDLNKAIDALVEAQKQSAWGNLAGGLILSGIGLLGNLGNKTSTNSNNSGGGWTMNYNSLYGSKNNYNTFFLTGSLPKMSSVAAPNTSWLNNNPLLA